jgi:hypothetical protein
MSAQWISPSSKGGYRRRARGPPVCGHANGLSSLPPSTKPRPSQSQPFPASGATNTNLPANLQ